MTDKRTIDNPIANAAPVLDDSKAAVAGPSAPQEPASPILLHEEVLDPKIEEAVKGRAVIRKRVETVEQCLTFDLHRQHPSIERRPVDMEIETAPVPYWDGNTLVVPVVEEEIVVQKRLILREELRVTLESETARHVIPAKTRREVVDVVEESGSPSTS